MAHATVDDVELRFRPLTEAERVAVAVKIEDAESILDERWPDLAQRVEDGSIAAVTVKRIVAAMVRRAMLNSGSEGVTQSGQTVGPFSMQQTYANPTSNLYLTADEIRSLDGAWGAPKVAMGWLL